MKLLRTIRLDPSDTFIFPSAAAPGEWAVPGAFVFLGADLAALEGKERAAFRAGFLGVASFSWSTLVQIVEATPNDRVAAVNLLAQHLFDRWGAPDLNVARRAAEEEIDFAASLCNHPADTLIALHRSNENGAIRETFRTLRPRGSPKPLRAFAFVETEGEDEPGDAVNLAALAREDHWRSWMKDFWLSCGHLLTDRDAGQGLLVTDELLTAYLMRPELRPPPEACDAERQLHKALREDPRRPIAAEEIVEIADADARQNWELMITFRDHLLRQKTLEGAYLDLVRHGVGKTPPIFLNQLVHLILRNVLDRCEDTLVLRAAELFFRPQRLTLHGGSLIAADEETIAGSSATPLSPLVSMLGLPAGPEIDVLVEDNATTYWERSDLFDMAIDLTAGRRGVAALGEAMSCWVQHMLSVAVNIEPLTEMRDVALSWYVGLDANATRIGDALWNGDALDEKMKSSVVGLYRLTFADAHVAAINKGEPVYLILAMSPDKVLRMKPQNLLTGLPVHHREGVQ